MSNEINTDFIKASQMMETIVLKLCFLDLLLDDTLSKNELSSDNKTWTVILLVVKNLTDI